MKHTLFSLIIGGSALTAFYAGAAGPDYSTGGHFVINEDWYGHQNSTVNFLRPDDPDGEYWEYRVFQANNPGMELGCTAQYGDIHCGKLFLISKQEKDPGASVTGGRITVADARTLKCITQLELIDPSGAQCDGRAFVGVDSSKGYVTTSNGVWILDLRTYRIARMIDGTGNPNVGDGKPNYDPSSSLYFGQCGLPVRSGNRVFVAHQSAGLLVIDTETDQLENILNPGEIIQDGYGIGSLTLSLDGTLWCSITADVKGSGKAAPCLLKVNPATLDYEVKELPDGIYPPGNSWYAWTPDGLCASAKQNVIYWNGGPDSWHADAFIYRYDIDADEITLWYTTTADGENWHLYHSAMRVDPETDQMYMSLYHTFNDPAYKVVRLDAEANTVMDYPMVSNYWFPSMPLFVTEAGLSSADATGIAAEDAAMTRILYIDGGFSVLSGCGLELCIHDLSGRTVFRKLLSDDHEVIYPSLEQGIYIVNAGDAVLKIKI